MTFTCSLILSAAMATAAPTTTPALELAPSLIPALTVTAVEAGPQLPARGTRTIRPQVEKWMLDRPERRPSALPVMYATLAALNALDAYSTRQALNAGAREANPLMEKASGNQGAMLAMKALSTAGTIYFSERAWKKNRMGAIITMVVVNGATAAIAAHNLRNARR